MSTDAPLAFLELFVVLAFGLVWFAMEKVAKRAARKYGTPETPPDDRPGGRDQASSS